MHTKTTILAAGLITLLNLAAATSAASATDFSGSRADVREFCVGVGYHLIEGGSYSLCVTETIDVVCNDAGVCSSTDVKLAEAAGFQRNRVG